MDLTACWLVDPVSGVGRAAGSASVVPPPTNHSKLTKLDWRDSGVFLSAELVRHVESRASDRLALQFGVGLLTGQWSLQIGGLDDVDW